MATPRKPRKIKTPGVKHPTVNPDYQRAKTRNQTGGDFSGIKAKGRIKR